jgi:predicted alpha/beta-hydrolase family hydrolase
VAAGGRRMGLLLAPGAGADRDQPGLVAVDRAVTTAGGLVRRMDFPYRRAGRRAPDRPAVLVGAVVEEARDLRRQTDGIAVGGRSMGGRIASMAVAEGLEADAVVLISYPLHPPGRPERRRVDHFPRLGVPCLFVSGTKDAFAAPTELEEAVAAIAGPVELHLVAGGDHGLRRHHAEVAGVVARWWADLLVG